MTQKTRERQGRYQPNRNPRLLDLFCGAGGAAVGYYRAGFDVVGVDINHQSYPFEFHQADALTFPLDGFDAIHASPPCQAYSSMKHMPDAKINPEFIEPIRARLIASGLPYIIENVPGAPLIEPVTLCGSMFGLGVYEFQLRRHRLFESTFTLTAPGLCAHTSPTIGVYGGHVRCRSAKFWRNTAADFPGYDKPALAKAAMGIDWMTLGEISEAIPPAYTEHVGRQLMNHIRSKEAAA